MKLYWEKHINSVKIDNKVISLTAFGNRNLKNQNSSGFYCKIFENEELIEIELLDLENVNTLLEEFGINTNMINLISN